MKLTENEIRALKYYIGDVEGDDVFWGDDKAYLVLNSLFYIGISTEAARAAEGKYLNPEILSDTDRLFELYGDLFSAFRKCSADSDIAAYRVERFSDYVLCRKEKRTVSFTSTSSVGFLDNYRDRSGIALMKFRITAGTPCIQMSKVLTEYAKSDEEEILLPPFLMLKITEIPLTEKERIITDSDGNPPVISCAAETVGLAAHAENIGKSAENGSEAGKRVLNLLNRKSIPDENDVKVYCSWKSAFINKVINTFA